MAKQQARQNHDDDYDYDYKPTQKRKKKRRGPNGCLIVLVLFAAALIGFGAYAMSLMKEVSGSETPGEQVSITIEQGQGPQTISTLLKDEGVIKRPELFRMYLKYKNAAGKLQYGTFTLTKGQDYDSIIETLSQTVKRETLRVTFPEGITAIRFAQIMEDAGLCTAEEFLQVANEGDFSQYDFWNAIPENENRFMKCEGYLFPDTYDFYLDDTVYNMVNTFYAEFDAKVTPEMRQRATEMGFTLDEMITLASFVQEEAGNANNERVSAVFHNRLAEGSPFPRLESNVSSYVQRDDDNNYIFNWIAPYYGGWDNIPQNIYSAYNTYELAGLPASAVSNPGIDAISATLYPDEEYLADKYYFFVTDKTGKYYYAKTVSEHNQNVSVAFSVK